MKILGIVAEYNPFHNGHVYHINKAKELTHSDYVVCVMSGNFVQKGEPAILNKWTRAKMALQNGVDICIELPLPYSIGSAEFFSFAAVKLLNDLGIVTDLCFGSELGEISPLKNIATLLNSEPPEYIKVLKSQLNKGLSYASSREIAIKSQFIDSNLDISEIISSSNNILGIEYIKALQTLNSSITPHTLNRTTTYNAHTLTNNISSATALRNLIANNDSYLNILKNHIPNNCIELLNNDFSVGKGPIFFNKFNDILISKLRSTSACDLSKINYVAEGLENRIKKYSDLTSTIPDLINLLCTKRYTRTRIQRILLNSLFNISKEKFERFNNNGGPQYIRILGFSKNGQSLLREIQHKASLPLLLNSSDINNLTDPIAKEMFELECLSTNLYVLAYNNPIYKNSNQDKSIPIIKEFS